MYMYVFVTTHTLIRVRDLLETNRKLEEKIADQEAQIKSGMETNKILIDEHQALQTLYNAHERKMNESQIEADQLVSTCMYMYMYTVHVQVPCTCRFYPGSRRIVQEWVGVSATSINVHVCKHLCGYHISFWTVCQVHVCCVLVRSDVSS